jgi:hypothetical protein
MLFEPLLTYLATPTSFADHGQVCCASAMQWLLGMDYAHYRTAGREAPPTWIGRKFRWGPVNWPIHWCDIPDRESLDCGGLTALATKLLKTRGFDARPAQAIFEFGHNDVSHWRSRWSSANCRTGWLHERWAYHEVTAVIDQGCLKLWDPSFNFWVDPPTGRGGYGDLVAVRVNADSQRPEELLHLGSYSLAPGSWSRFGPSTVVASGHLERPVAPAQANGHYSPTGLRIKISDHTIGSRQVARQRSEHAANA